MRSLLLHYIYINFLDIFVLVSKALRKCWSKQPTTITILWFFLKGSIFNQFISTGFIVSYSISRKPKVKSQLLEADRECVSKVCAKLSWEYWFSFFLSISQDLNHMATNYESSEDFTPQLPVSWTANTASALTPVTSLNTSVWNPRVPPSGKVCVCVCGHTWFSWVCLTRR